MEEIKIDDKAIERLKKKDNHPREYELENTNHVGPADG